MESPRQTDTSCESLQQSSCSFYTECRPWIRLNWDPDRHILLSFAFTPSSAPSNDRPLTNSLVCWIIHSLTHFIGSSCSVIQCSRFTHQGMRFLSHLRVSFRKNIVSESMAQVCLQTLSRQSQPLSTPEWDKDAQLKDMLAKSLIKRHPKMVCKSTLLSVIIFLRWF